MVEGTEQDIRNAEAILGNCGMRDWNIFVPIGGIGDRSVDADIVAELLQFSPINSPIIAKA
jgi:hypothetical protein